MLATTSPFPQYFDKDGKPLDSGYLYFGTAGANPETSPVTAYWDAAGTQPAAQPIRTKNGFAARNGTPAAVYISGDYSTTVRDKRKVLVFYAQSSASSGGAASLTLDLADTTTATKGAGMSGFNVLLSYAAGTVGAAIKSALAPAFSSITGKPTTASGYGLTDVASLAALNVLDNPAFNVNQRGYVSGAATTGANQVTLDRWRVPTSGQSVTFSASGAGNTVTFPASGGEQIIRAASIRGGTYTVAWTGAGTCTINGTTAANGSQVTLPANTQVSIKFFGVVGEVMLVPGSATGPFVLRPYAEELRRCQVEYVQELFYFARYGQAAGTWAFSSGMMPVTMGATPSMGFIGAVNYGFCSGGAINVDGPRSYHMTATVASASEFNMSGTYYASTGI